VSVIGALGIAVAMTSACTSHADERVEPSSDPHFDDEAAVEPAERSTTAAACVKDHPSHVTDADLQALIGWCTHAGHATDRCVPELLISADAALCIARAEGIDEGAAPTTVTARSFGERPSWDIQSTSSSGAGYAAGDSWTVDAWTGEVVSRLGWNEHGY
jgi:hypothetical protein